MDFNVVDETYLFTQLDDGFDFRVIDQNYVFEVENLTVLSGATPVGGALLASNNLSDLVDDATARANLDVSSTSEVTAEITAAIDAIDTGGDGNGNGGNSSNMPLLGSIENGLFAVNTGAANVWYTRIWSQDNQNHYQARGSASRPNIFGNDRPFAIIPAGTVLNRLDVTVVSPSMSYAGQEIFLGIVSSGATIDDWDFSTTISNDGLGGGIDHHFVGSKTPVSSQRRFGHTLDLGETTVTVDSLAYFAIRYTGAAVTANRTANMSVHLR